MTEKIIQGDCVEQMRLMAENSVDSIITDPPYELGFMNKAWDSSGIAFDPVMWREALRVLKPGGHLLAFSGSRTYHRIAVAIEEAGFEIRDQIMWIYGSGFPKSLDIHKAINKIDGVEFREKPADGVGFMNAEGAGGYNVTINQLEQVGESSERAKQWQGWGTALKPAHEPIVVARKPLIGTVAANVLTYGTGGLNIDGARVGRAEGDDSVAGKRTATFGTQETQSGGDGSGGWEQNSAGRWPANVIHDGSDEVLELFPDTGKSTGGRIGKKAMGNVTNVPAGEYKSGDPGYGDSGSAARFFYCAKASKRDRNEGLEKFDAIRVHDGRTEGGVGGSNPRNRTNTAKVNHHPTVKPTDLMRYLCRLVTPFDGIILDPFMGSGSTGKAAVLEGFDFIGIEQDAEYVRIAQTRIDFAKNNTND